MNAQSAATRDHRFLPVKPEELSTLHLEVTVLAPMEQISGIESIKILKVHEGRPNIVDAIKNKEIDLVVNTPAGRLSEYDDSYIRKNAIKYKIPYITTTSAALSSTEGIRERQNGEYKVKSLQEYHSEITD